MIFTRKFFKLCGGLIVFLSIFNIVYIFVLRNAISNIVPKYSGRLKREQNEKVSWEDVEFMKYESTRVGPGEHGVEVILTDPALIELNDAWVKREGFYVGVSDNISLTRALPDHGPAV